MIKCVNCGASIKDDAKFCTECGTPISQNDSPVTPADSAVTEPTAPELASANPAMEQAPMGQDSFANPAMGQAPMGQDSFTNPAMEQAQYNAFQQAPPKKKKLGTGALIGIICGVVAIIIAIIVVIAVVAGGGKGYEKTIKNFESGLNNRDIKKIISVLPLDSASSALLGYSSNMIGDSLLDEFGLYDSDYKVKFEVTDSEKMSLYELADTAESSDFNFWGSSDTFKLTDGYYVYCNATIVGNGNISAETVTFTVCKWNGKWYIFDMD